MKAEGQRARDDVCVANGIPGEWGSDTSDSNKQKNTKKEEKAR